MSRRRGFSLVELLLVMSAGAILLAIGAGLIRSLMTIDRAGRARLVEESHVDRLGRLFRADVHAATGHDPSPDPRDRLKLTRPGGRSVEYRALPGAVVRIESADGRGPREERFETPSRPAARLEVSEDGDRAVASLVLDRPPDRDGPRTLRVEAVLGRDHRFAPSGVEDQ